ncbi:MAG: hypothetical protein WCD18_16455 [Thermosynechococcaceae cyanobacterium]
MFNLPESFNQLLTPEECTQIDQTLLPTRDRFSIRITVYSWRYLQEMSQALGIAIEDLQPDEIHEWLHQDSTLQTQTLADHSFIDWFSHLLISSRQPLTTIAQQKGINISQLTLSDIIGWFEAQVKEVL